MAWETVRNGTNDVWTYCQNYGIDQNNLGNFKAWVSHGHAICVYDSKAGAGSQDRKFLLVSPDLSSKYLQRLVTLLRGKRMTCGFEIREARGHQEVFVIDPDGDFSDAELAPLALDGVNVTRVPGQTLQELALGLEGLLP